MDIIRIALLGIARVFFLPIRVFANTLTGRDSLHPGQCIQPQWTPKLHPVNGKSQERANEIDPSLQKVNKYICEQHIEAHGSS